MSILIHRCKCGHPDFFHAGTGAGACSTACGCTAICTDDEPELLPTWDALGKPVTAIAAPGTRWNGIKLCDCPLCEMRHSELDGPAT